MAKSQVKFCPECGTYRKHTYVGKTPEEKDELDIAFTIMTLGMYQISKKLCDDRPKLWECTKCGHISEA